MCFMAWCSRSNCKRAFPWRSGWLFVAIPRRGGGVFCNMAIAQITEGNGCETSFVARGGMRGGTGPPGGLPREPQPELDRLARAECRGRLRAARRAGGRQREGERGPGGIRLLLFG